MEYDKEKVAETVLALLYLTQHGDKYGVRAWKNIDWDTMDMLYEKGYIGDPKNKSKSVLLTKKGESESKRLFEELFGKTQD